MKRIMTLAIMAAMALPAVAAAQSEGYYDRSFIRLSYVKGDVFIQRAQDLGYEQGEVNLVVVEGDKLGTRDGRAELQLGRGNVLRLDLETQIDIAGLSNRDEDPTKIHILNGNVFLRVRSLDREKNLEIHTPDASFYILEPGLYRVGILENRETEFSVLSGQAEAAGEEGSIVVGNGEMITASDGRFPSEPMRLQARRDGFDSWNESRDALYAVKLNRTYLPAEYSEYDYELSAYGRWAYESSYGYVWVPSVNYADWRPYSYGRWSWYPIIGWTWISYEPWGWCTSHYGRWGWRGGLGWYWIPMSRWAWGPAWVHWYHGRDHIGWCALSYYNRPAVIINNFFYDRYDRADFPHNSRTLMVVRRDQLQNRRLTQVALNDRNIRDLGRISLRSAQPDLRPSINRNSGLALQARKVLDRGTLRSVNKNFSSEGRKLSPGQLRSAPIRKSESGDLSRGRTADGRGSGISRDPLISGRAIERKTESSPRSVPERVIRPRSGEPAGGVSDRGANRVAEREGMRVFPSRSNSGAENKASQPSLSNREVSPSRLRTSPAPKTGKTNRPARTVKEPEKKVERSNNQNRTIRERPGSSGIVSRPNSSTRSNVLSGGSTSRPAGTPSRSLSSPSRSLNTPSRSSSSSPRTYAAPSRSSSSSGRSVGAPSRRLSSSSRSLNAPSRSSSSSPRTYAAPSRSSSSSGRSVGAPSRRSSSPSRSTSSPSRSSVSAPSRSSSSSSSRGTSRSSGGSRSSGSIRRK